MLKLNALLRMFVCGLHGVDARVGSRVKGIYRVTFALVTDFLIRSGNRLTRIVRTVETHKLHAVSLLSTVGHNVANTVLFERVKHLTIRAKVNLVDGDLVRKGHAPSVQRSADETKLLRSHVLPSGGF